MKWLFIFGFIMSLISPLSLAIDTPATDSLPTKDTSSLINNKFSSSIDGTSVKSLGSVSDTGVVEVVLGLCFVVLVIFFCAWLMRRLNGMSAIGGQVMRTLATLPLGARERVTLVQVGDQQMLLGVAPGRINLLCLFDEPVINLTKENEDMSTSDFAKKIQDLISRGTIK